MQSLFVFLSHLFSKAWVTIVVTTIAGSAAFALYVSSVDTGTTSKTGGQPIVVVQPGPVAFPKHSGQPPVVPEGNAGLVLIPVVAAMLLLSSRRLLPAKASLVPGNQETAVDPGA
jgi:hypothetical protein